jgi:hypothetical protein
VNGWTREKILQANDLLDALDEAQEDEQEAQRRKNAAKDR